MYENPDYGKWEVGLEFVQKTGPKAPVSLRPTLFPEN